MERIANLIFIKTGMTVCPRTIVKLPEDPNNQSGIHVDTYAVKSGADIIILQDSCGDVDIELVDIA